jgi:hypothetical protein
LARHLAFSRQGALVVMVTDASTPAPSEWDEYLNLCQEVDRELPGGISSASAIIFSDGGSPDMSQRGALRKRMHGSSARVALVTDEMIARSMISLIALFNPGLRGFPSSRWTEGARFAGVPPEKDLEVLRVALGLSRQVTECKTLRTIGL